MLPTVLFLCSGNYYRSRFAEFYFRHLAARQRLAWQSDSRGLALDNYNPGHMSAHTERLCEQMGISTEPLRFPMKLTAQDLNDAAIVIAVKETEHRPMIRRQFPDWEDRIEYWEVHDLDVEPASVALPQLVGQVEQLLARLAARDTVPAGEL
ncbi:MAG: hypothetical protein R3E01_00755 [Pirellulaceae bacterium]|nr:low molecular weight phosphatase family protein [Planctomycetales bacterium]